MVSGAMPSTLTLFFVMITSRQQLNKYFVILFWVDQVVDSAWLPLVESLWSFGLSISSSWVSFIIGAMVIAFELAGSLLHFNISFGRELLYFDAESS